MSGQTADEAGPDGENLLPSEWTMNGPFAELNNLIESAQPTMLPDLIGQLAAMQARAQLLMLANSRPEQRKEATGKAALLTAKQVAERLNKKTCFVYEMARQKKLQSVKMGDKYVMFTETAVQEFLAQAGA